MSQLLSEHNNSRCVEANSRREPHNSCGNHKSP